MKKFGFTLAEVLITLTIIGVVAAVTLPALQANVQEQANIAKYKKAVNILSNIGATLEAQQEFNYSDCAFDEKINEGANATRGIDPATGRLRRQIWAVLNEYAKLDRVASQNIQPSDIGGICETAGGGEGGVVSAVVFKDGTALCWNSRGWNGALGTWHFGVIDTNGVRPPNRESRCDNENCSAGKQINDQFRITFFRDEIIPGYAGVDADNQLAGGWVNMPGSFASRWAFNQ